MQKSFAKMFKGYQTFRKKYDTDNNSIMRKLADKGQRPEIMVVACCDSRVDPALILQCDPGELFVVRNVANIVPPYEKDEMHHGTSAALEFGICFLNVKHLVLLGHSQCGGVNALLNGETLHQDDFISNWVTLIDSTHRHKECSTDEYAKLALKNSRQNCMTFPWLKERAESEKLQIHLWFFDIKSGQILAHDDKSDEYKPLATT